ncbi:flagellin, partial [Vibrio parahaemolyticus]
MSLRINSNIAAMDALLNINNTQDDITTSIERLSSGLRINNAADDPAGLIVSEDLRSKIQGIGQA